MTEHQTPKGVPTEDYIDNLWAAVRAGQITWDDVRHIQAQAMPRCEAHDRPANVRIGKTPFCERCIEDGRHRGK